MQKSKLGVTVGLVGAAVYFTGLISFIPLMLLAVYILFMEENEWLRKSAVKAVTIVVIYNLICVVFGLGDNIFDIINDIFYTLHIDTTLDYPLYIDDIAIKAAGFIENLLLVVLGLKAMAQGSFKVKAIDNIIDKNM
ncbi:hypothetical protein [Anaeromicropila herbilytica]|uniref:Uncharacterized protein n=1 Tax=Anaeromicropila herbilytica TaxID=2785025 RepID=A0A7R7EM07_9FIRM|nr:hypothetical protein [Anaeromicropila herbilytica]BCN31435.1 hypothetical protein bsdtb5_27300 [Anaeromicropila herbilytica]